MLSEGSAKFALGCLKVAGISKMAMIEPGHSRGKPKTVLRQIPRSKIVMIRIPC